MIPLLDEITFDPLFSHCSRSPDSGNATWCGTSIHCKISGVNDAHAEASSAGRAKTRGRPGNTKAPDACARGSDPHD